MNPFVVLGSDGQLGGEFVSQLGTRAVAAPRNQLDLANPDNILPFIERWRPRYVINCAAYTAVDQAQTEQKQCLLVNSDAVNVLVQACAKWSIPLVQISTDYVFDSYQGDDPIQEDEQASPRGFYAHSKRLGEIAAADKPGNLIVRTCGLYGGGPSYRNFVETMLRLSETRHEVQVVDDQCCTPSYCRDVVSAILRLMELNASGIFHVTNSGSTTWHEFAETIFRLANKPVRVLPISTEQYGAPAPRPRYSVLDNARLIAQTGRPLPAWEDALERYLRDRYLQRQVH